MVCTDKQVFPSLEFIGWYTVAPHPTIRHIALHEQVLRFFSLIIEFYRRPSKFTGYCSTPLLLLLQPNHQLSSDVNAQTLPFKAYEPTVEIKDRKSRPVFVEAPYNVETGEAERIAVDWTARGGGGGTSCASLPPWLT
jgi:COP9 signalosome complex subunit 6